MRWRWENLQAKLVKLSMKGLALNQCQQSGATLLNELKNISNTLLSAKSVIDGQMSLGSMVAVQYIVGQLNSPIEQLVGFMQSWQNAKISMDRLIEIHQMEDEEPAEKEFQHHLLPCNTKHLVGGMGFVDFKIEQEYVGSLYDRAIVMDKSNLGSKQMQLNNIDDLAIHIDDLSFSYLNSCNKPVLKSIDLQIPYWQAYCNCAI